MKIKHIDSPLSAFNNFILNIGEDLNKIFGTNLYAENNVLFDNDGILLFGSIRLALKNNEFVFKINTEINKYNKDNIRLLFDNYYSLETILYKYLFTLNLVTNNFDDSISYRYLDLLVDECFKLDKDNNKYYLIPYKNKISKLQNDTTLQNLLNRYSYLLEVRCNGPKQFEVLLLRVLSSELNQNNSIDNVKFLEKEIIRKSIITKEYFPKFINDLMIYGEYNDGRKSK